MTEMALISSVFDWTSGVFTDTKFITSVLVGAVGTAATVMRNLREIKRDSSRPAMQKLETAKVAELLDLLAKVPPGESFSACRKELELQLDHSVRALDALRTKVSKLSQAPNHDLTLVERLLILFPPCSQRAWIIHALAYTFMAGGPLVVLLLVLFGIGNAGAVEDVVVLVVFGSLAFRAWALAERKWAIESAKPAESVTPAQIESGPLTTVFALRKSTSWKMLVAQVCLWACLFCAVESLEDIFLAGTDASEAATELDKASDKAKYGNVGGKSEAQVLKAPNEALNEARNDAKAGLLLFLTSLLGAGICRAWTLAEWKNGSTSACTTFAKAIFPRPKRVTPVVALVTASYVTATALLIGSAVAWSLIFKDAIDRIEFSFVWLTACIACNRLLSIHPYTADNFTEDKPPALSQSAAA